MRFSKIVGEQTCWEGVEYHHCPNIGPGVGIVFGWVGGVKGSLRALLAPPKCSPENATYFSASPKSRGLWNKSHDIPCMGLLQS